MPKVAPRVTNTNEPVGANQKEDRKRKRDSLDHSSPHQQQRIKELLPSAVPRSDSLSDGRIRKDDALKSTRPHPRYLNLPQSDMYNFPSRTPQKNGVIDLTSSSPAASPIARKPRPTHDAHLGAKKLVVKNFRTTPRSDPKVFIDGVLTKTDAALDAIYSNGNIGCSMEELYKGIENACRFGSAEIVYKRLEEKRTAAIVTRTVPALQQIVGQSDAEFLRAVLAAWTEWKAHTNTVRNIYMYLDRAFLLQTGKPSIQEAGITLFRKFIFSAPQFQDKILGGACELISEDRAGHHEGLDLCKQVISMFHELKVYTTHFEPKLLELSQIYINDYAVRTAKDLTLAGYVVSTLELMEREVQRCDACSLDIGTRGRLLTLLEQHLIHRQQQRLTREAELFELLDDNAVDLLEKLYSLLERLKLENLLRKPFEKWIDNTGTQIVFDEKKQNDMVVNLLSLRKQLDNIWQTSFHRDVEIGHGLRGAFEAFINKSKKTNATWGTDNSKPGEMIAKYVDLLLRGGSKVIPASLSKTTAKATEEEEDDDLDEDKVVDNQLDQVLDLFRFIHGKAVFEAFYKKDLAKRLLLNRSASSAAEISMLSRLKTECGAQFTTNLDQMFKDIDLAKEEMDSYKTMLQERGQTSTIDLNVNILSAAAWPTYGDIPVNIPTAIKAEIDNFEKIYQMKHSGRKLTWKHGLAHCQMKAKFPRGTKEFVLSGFQAVVLLVFNGISAEEKVSYERLKGETGLPDPELKRTLQSLACAKIRPLRKHPAGRDIDDADTFTWNAAFHNDKYRVKINQVQLKETKEENKETHERVAADRNFETQAAIVRIMKSKKVIAHNLLVAEVIDATKKRGVLSVGDIKKNIDRLIDKEYMEREEGNTYSYVA